MDHDTTYEYRWWTLGVPPGVRGRGHGCHEVKETPMHLVSRAELLADLGQGRDIELVMSLGSWASQAQHIPGSLHFDSPQDAFATLDLDDDIVVYCAGAASRASERAYHQLVQRGYRHVRRYAGGIADWAAAGLPLEGCDS